MLMYDLLSLSSWLTIVRHHNKAGNIVFLEDLVRLLVEYPDNIWINGNR